MMEIQTGKMKCWVQCIAELQCIPFRRFQNCEVLRISDRMVDDGALYRTGYDKYGFRINTSGQKGIFSYGENFYYTKSDRKILNGNPWSDFIGMPPTIPVYDESHVGGYGYGDVDRANSYG